MFKLKIEEDGETYIYQALTIEKITRMAFKTFKDDFDSHEDVNINVTYLVSLLGGLRFETNTASIKTKIEEMIIADLEESKRQIEEEKNYSESGKVGMNEADF